MHRPGVLLGTEGCEALFARAISGKSQILHFSDSRHRCNTNFRFWLQDFLSGLKDLEAVVVPKCASEYPLGGFKQPALGVE